MDMQNEKTNLGTEEEKDLTEVSTSDKSQDKGTERVEPLDSRESLDSEDSHDLSRKLEEMGSKLEAMRTQYLRAVADLDNFRKRSTRERQELTQYACVPLVKELLPILDSFKAGMKVAEEAVEKDPKVQAMTEGFSLVFKQLFGILSQSGLKEVNPEGEPFDPNFHECLTYQPSDVVPADTVISVTLVGYTFHERLLRSATVLVSSGPAKVNNESTNTNV